VSVVKISVFFQEKKEGFLGSLVDIPEIKFLFNFVCLAINLKPGEVPCNQSFFQRKVNLGLPKLSPRKLGRSGNRN